VADEKDTESGLVLDRRLRSRRADLEEHRLHRPEASDRAGHQASRPYSSRGRAHIRRAAHHRSELEVAVVRSAQELQ
jgi:hypothetical protein